MDDAQLAPLYERYGYLVHRRCLQLVRRPEDAEDALQETFLRVKRYGPPARRRGHAGLALHGGRALLLRPDGDAAGASRLAEESQLAALEERGGARPRTRTGARCSAPRCAAGRQDAHHRRAPLPGRLHPGGGGRPDGLLAQTIGKKLKQFEDRIRQLLAGTRQPRGDDDDTLPCPPPLAAPSVLPPPCSRPCRAGEPAPETRRAPT